MSNKSKLIESFIKRLDSADEKSLTIYTQGKVNPNTFPLRLSKIIYDEYYLFMNNLIFDATYVYDHFEDNFNLNIMSEVVKRYAQKKIEEYKIHVDLQTASKVDAIVMQIKEANEAFLDLWHRVKALTIDYNEENVLFLNWNYSTPNDPILRRLFDVTFLLFQIDCLFKLDNNIEHHLLQIRKNIIEYTNRANTSEMAEVNAKLLSKCNYLLYKIYHKKDRDRETVCYFDNGVKRLEYEDFKDEYNAGIIDLYDSFNDVDKPHILQRKAKESRKIIATGNRVKNIDFLFWARYCTKENKKLKDIDYTIERYNDYYTELYYSVETTDVDRLALNSTKQFLYNCRLSVDLDCNPFSLDRLDLIDSQVDDIISMQQETGVFNYYPYYKVLKAIKKSKTEDYFSFEEVDSNVVERFVKFFEKMLEKYEKCMDWCLDKSFRPVQFMKADNVDNHMFIASNISSPLQTDDLYNRLEEYKEMKHVFVVEAEQRKSVLRLNKISEDVKNFRTQFYQIGGILVALMSFILGTIQFFSKSNMVSSCTIYKQTIGLGAVLLIFVAGILMVSEAPKEKRYLHMLGFLIFVFVLFFLPDFYDILRLIFKV